MLVALEAFVTLAWLRVVLRIAPARALRGTLAREGDGNPFIDRRLIETFNRVAARTPIAHNCMHRSLALQRMLARRGVASTLRIGLGRRPNLFPGHAWLECGGVVINDDAALVARYEPLTLTESALTLAFR